MNLQLLFPVPSHDIHNSIDRLDSEEASLVLCRWLSLWHPQTIALAGTMPRWISVTSLPAEMDHCLLAISPIVMDLLGSDDMAKYRSAGAKIIDEGSDWREAQRLVLHSMRSSFADQATTAEKISDTDCLEFTAIGYGLLQMHFLSQQLHYESRMDFEVLNEQVVHAAESLLKGDHESASQLMQACFDSLGQERDNYYAVELSLLDLTLVAKTTLGASLSKQLQREHCVNFLISGDDLTRLSDQNEACFEILRAKQKADQAAILGGLCSSNNHLDASVETMVRDLQRGIVAIDALGLKRPAVFARQDAGLTALTPSILKKFGYQGVLLYAFTEENYAITNRSRLEWESDDGTVLSAVRPIVLDAADPKTYLLFGKEVGHELETARAPVVCLAHWPNRYHAYFDLLAQVVSRTPAFGVWTTASTYFSESEQAYNRTHFPASTFQRGPVLSSMEEAEGLQRNKHYHILSNRLRSLQNLAVLSMQLRWRPSNEVESDSAATSPYKAHLLSDISASLANLAERVDGLLSEPYDNEVVSQLYLRMKATKAEIMEQLAKSYGFTPIDKGSVKEIGRLVQNAISAPIRKNARVTRDQSLDSGAAWSYAVGQVGEETVHCVDVPAMGFVASSLVKRNRSKPVGKPIAENNYLLQNEFFEAMIDTTRGYLKSIYIPAKRGNRMGAQIACRRRSNQAIEYSQMVAEDVSMVASSDICATICAKGELRFEDEVCGRFEIDYTVWRGSRIVDMRIRLTDLIVSEQSMWNHCYVLRVAWPEEYASVSYSAQGRIQTWTDGIALSPWWIEIDEVDHKSQYLTGGLSRHRRIDTRFIESVLACGAMAGCDHRVGFGVDLQSPASAARDFFDVRYECGLAELPKLTTGWTVSSDVRSVLVDLDTTLVNEQGRIVGVRISIRETTGRAHSAHVRLLHPIAAAFRVDYLGAKISKLATAEDSLTIALRKNEHAMVDVLWK